MSDRNRKAAARSLRFSPEEVRLIEEVSRREHLPEAVLLRKLVLDGLERHRLDLAIRDFSEGSLNLGQAAHQAGVSVQRLMAQLDRCGVPDGIESHVLASLGTLVDLFGGSPELRETLATLDAAQKSDIA